MKLTCKVPELPAQLQTAVRPGCNARSRKRNTFPPFLCYSPKPQSESTGDHRENAADYILTHTNPAVDARMLTRLHTHALIISPPCASLSSSLVSVTRFFTSFSWHRTTKEFRSLTLRPENGEREGGSGPPCP